MNRLRLRSVITGSPRHLGKGRGPGPRDNRSRRPPDSGFRRNDGRGVFFLKHALMVALLASLSSPAFAHALLQKAVPAVGSTVHAPPASVTLRFSEGVEPTFSTIAVSDAAGTHFEAAAPQNAPDNQKVLSVALKPLAAGTYTVEWHATSVDTHKTEGKFTFTVAP